MAQNLKSQAVEVEQDGRIPADVRAFAVEYGAEEVGLFDGPVKHPWVDLPAEKKNVQIGHADLPNGWRFRMVSIMGTFNRITLERYE